ncbi:MAG: 30S ribosomal protein S1 [Candidatus Xenobium sp.]|jgi:ribosomal protein S1|nr:30S ribosomal protein S1 [Burkholderiales bacterium]
MDNLRPTGFATEEEANPTQTATEVSSENPASDAADAVSEEAPQDMASAMADFAAYEESFKSISPGEFLTGRVVRVDSEGVLVDVGYKTEGLVPLSQLTHRRDVPADEIVKVGDEIDVVVQRVDESEGTLMLSKKRADLESAWRRVLKANETGETLTATCTEQVKGGLIVDLGLRGFVPASHVDVRPVHDLSDFVGEVLPLKVLEVDRGRRKVVLSRKKAVEEERQKLKEQTLAELAEGQVLSGTVARLTNFGAFINLGGVDGLVHISELSWKRIKHPSEVVQPGQAVEVLVLKVDPKRERISLSLRQARPDPWLTIEEQYKVGDVVNGRVTKLAKNYAFVELQEGVEGLVPLRELADYRVNRPEEVLQPGQELEVRVIELNADSRRMVLSVRQVAAMMPEGQARMRHSESNSGGFTIGDLLKSKFTNSEMQQMLGQTPTEGE